MANDIVKKNKDVTEVRPLESYSQEEIEKYEKITRSLDITKPNSVLMYGSELSNVAEQAADELLKATRRSNAGDVGEQLGQLLSKLGEIKLNDPGQAAGWKRKLIKYVPFLKPVLDDYEKFTSRYDTVKDSFDKIKEEVNIIKTEIQEGTSETELLYKSISKYKNDIEELIEAGQYKLATIDKQLSEMDNNDPEKQKLTVFRNTLNNDIFQKIEQKYLLQSSMAQIVTMTADDAMICQKAQRVVGTTIPLMKQKAQVAIKALKLRYYCDVFDGIDQTADALMKSASKAVESVTVDIANQAVRDDIKFETLIEEMDANIRTVEQLNQILRETGTKRLEQVKELEQKSIEMKKVYGKTIQTADEQKKLFGNGHVEVKELK